jgi:hypothetical protein
MIKHIVMWNVRGENAEEKQIKSRFEGLVGQIPGLRHLEVGLDVSVASYACDVVLYSEFEDAAALTAYADHPAHLKVREELRDVRTARYQVDYIANKKG